MQIMSWYFALFVMVGLVLFHARQSAGWKRSILALMNVAFLASFADSWLELVPLAGVQFPKIPGVAFPTIMHLAYPSNYGPDFRTNGACNRGDGST